MDKKRKGDKSKKNDLKSFLKKRAPIYLAVVAILIVFVLPEVTKGTLEKSLPEFSAEEQQVVDILMKYDGPNDTGLTVMEALEEKIAQEYPNEKIYDHKKTMVNLKVTSVSSDEYQVTFDFTSYKGDKSYSWNVDVETQTITSNNSQSKHIIELVNYYD